MTAEPLDLKRIRDEWLVQCGPCDYGMVEMGCACPDGEPRLIISQLVDEVERLRADRTADRRRNAARVYRTIARRIPHMAPGAAMQWLLDTADNFDQAAEEATP